MLKCINYDAPNFADFYHASVVSSHSRLVLYSIKLKLHKTREGLTRKKTCRPNGESEREYLMVHSKNKLFQIQKYNSLELKIILALCPFKGAKTSERCVSIKRDISVSSLSVECAAHSPMLPLVCGRGLFKCWLQCFLPPLTTRRSACIRKRYSVRQATLCSDSTLGTQGRGTWLNHNLTNAFCAAASKSNFKLMPLR